MGCWLIALIVVCVKTLVFHVACCKSDKELEPPKRKLGWYLSSIPALASFVLTVIGAFFATPAIIAANPYAHMPPADIFSSFVAGMPLWYAWLANIVLVPLGYFALSNAELNRLVGSILPAYFAVTVTEYFVIIFGLSLVSYH